MTCEEFSDQLDTLLNSYNLQADFGEGATKQGITLDEYEKSVLLTQAQDNIVKSYFDRNLNAQGQGMDDSTRRQVDFSSLVKVAKFSSTDIGNLDHVAEYCYDDRGLILNLGESRKILFILNEKLEVSDADKNIKNYVVVPINYKEYDREMSKAYAQPLKKQAWRLFSNTSTGYDINSEIIPIYGTILLQRKTTYYASSAQTDDDGEVTGYYWKQVDKYSGSVEDTVDSLDLLPDASADNVGKFYALQEVTPLYEVTYVIRYVKRPTPIVLRDLPDGLSIDDVSTKTECALNPILHVDILNKAFELALTTRGGGTVQRTAAPQPQQQQQ